MRLRLVVERHLIAGDDDDDDDDDGFADRRAEARALLLLQSLLAILFGVGMGEAGEAGANG